MKQKTLKEYLRTKPDFFPEPYPTAIAVDESGVEVYFRYGILYLKLPSFIRYLLHFCSLNDKRYSFKKQYNLPRVYFEYRHARITYDNGKIEVYGLGISKKLVKWMFKELEKFYQDFLNIYKKEVSGWGG